MKQQIEKEAAEKTVEAMMIGLDDEVPAELQTNKKFDKPYLFSAISSMPSKPDEVKLTEQNCTSEDQATLLYDSVPGLKMYFVNGKLYKTNVILQDNEFEYYRLIGEAYNTRKLDRSTIAKDAAASIHSESEEESQSSNQHYTYVIKGVPQTLAHDSELDSKYSYSKQVFIDEPKHKELVKLYSTTCEKLKYNSNN